MDEETQVDLAASEQEEGSDTLEENTSDESLVDSDDDSAENSSPVDELADRVSKLEDYAKNQKTRAEKAEAKLKATAKEIQDSDKSELSNQGSDSLSREEAVLIAKGHTLEEIEKIKSLAALDGVSVLEASENELFTAWKEKQDKQREAAEAQMGASKGSGRRKPKKSFTTPGLTPEEHKKLFEEKMRAR